MKIVLLRIISCLFLLFPHLLFSQFQIEEGTVSMRVDENGNPTNTYFGAPGGGLTNFNSSPYEDFHLSFNGGFRMNYRFLSPIGYDPTESTKKYPMIVMLHGAGESGRSWPGKEDPYPYGTKGYLNNDRNLHHGGKEHLEAVKRDPPDSNAFPGFVLFPQNKTGDWKENEWNTELSDAIKIIELIIKNYHVDPNRIYVHGLSKGGEAVWRIVEMRPDLFAAWLPMSASRTYDYDYGKVSHIPGWIFQGGLDNNPKPSQTNTALGFLRDAGATPRFTLYPTIGHPTWYTAYREDDFFSWMLAQSKLNIHPDGGLTAFCESSGVNTTIGISPGFATYQWKRNGQIIDGATSNELNVTDFGTYTVGFMRQEDTDTTWSNPLEIVIKEIPPLAIQASGSVVLNSLDNKTEVTLSAPEGVIASTWYKDGDFLSNEDSVTVSQDGAYVLKATTVACETTSEPVFVSTGGDITIDAYPANLTASAVSESQIDLFWEDLSPDKTGFELYRSTTPGSNYSFVGRLDARAVNFSDTGLAPGTTYYYVLRSVNSTGASNPTPEVSAITYNDETAPSAPQALQISRVDINYITLNWEPSADNVGVDKYRIYQVGDNNPVGETGKHDFTVENLVEGQVYQFYVKAVDKAGHVSPPSNQVTGLTSFCGLYYEVYGSATYNSVDELGNPEGLAGSGKINNFNLDVVSLHASLENYFGIIFNGYLSIDLAGEYTFYTTSDDGSQLLIDDVIVVDNDGRHNGATKVTSVPVHLDAGAHKIQVKFFQAPSPYYLEVGYTPPGGSEQVIPDNVLCSSSATLPPPPASPSLLTATAISDTEIELSWVDNSDNETGFEIYRAKEGQEFSLIAISGANTGSHSDTGLDDATTYFYKIRAIGPTGQSSFTHKDGALRYDYYEGDWSLLPKFSKLNPVKTGSVENFSLTPRGDRNDFFAFVFEGLIEIPEEGTYTFYTASDDGSKLYINGTLVVDNDGLHGTEEESGVIHLPKGNHRIRVTYFERDGGETLYVRYKGPGTNKQAIPDGAIISHVSAMTSGDVTPPSKPADVMVRTKTHESVGLSWTASSDNVGVAAYDVYNYGEFTASVDVAGDQETVSYLVTALKSDTPYGFEIRARDKAGNRSEASSPVEVVTNAFDPLPVEFISFTGEFNMHKVILQWSTATETNNDYFTVERSSSGDDFEAIATLAGAGNSQSRIDYEYVDFTPVAGTAYYRIRQTDFNGRAKFSKIISVNGVRLTSRSLKIYPNPTGGQILKVVLESFDTKSPVSVQIIGVLGMKYHEGTYKAIEMVQGVHINQVSTLAPGIYTVILKQGDMVMKERLIVN